MNTNATTRVADYLNSLSNDYDGHFALIDIHNRYCDEVNDPDATIYSMVEFDDILGSMTPSEIAMRIVSPNWFNPLDDFFWFDAYGNLGFLRLRPEVR